MLQGYQKQVNWIEELHQQGIALQFNSNLFTRGDSRERTGRYQRQL